MVDGITIQLFMKINSYATIGGHRCQFKKLHNNRHV